jgi:hypothetical protein
MKASLMRPIAAVRAHHSLSYRTKRSYSSADMMAATARPLFSTRTRDAPLSDEVDDAIQALLGVSKRYSRFNEDR